MNKDLWQLKREFLEYCEIEKGQSLLTIGNYERYLNRFLVWLESEKSTQISNDKFLISNQIKNPKSKNNNEAMKQYSNGKKEQFNKAKIKLHPEDITREEVRKYRLYVNRLYDKKGKELKATTQNHHILALRAFLRYLSMQGVKTVSPDEIALAKVGERKVNFLTAEEYQRLLAAPQKSPRDKAILELLFSTGMRVSELTSLNVGDINFERGEIAVLGKGKKVRVVFISTSAIDTLSRYLQQRGVLQVKSEIRNPKSETNPKSEAQISNEIQNPNKTSSSGLTQESTNSLSVDPRRSLPRALKRGGDDKASEANQANEANQARYFVPDVAKKQPLFLSSLGNRLNVRGIERLVAKYAKIAGITKNVSPHTLRHTFATDLLIAGADIRSVQSLLGHSNISTTQVYTHVTDQHLRDIHKKFHNRNNAEK